MCHTKTAKYVQIVQQTDRKQLVNTQTYKRVRPPIMSTKYKGVITGLQPPQQVALPYLTVVVMS